MVRDLRDLVKVRSLHQQLVNLLWMVCHHWIKLHMFNFASVYKNFKEAKDFEQFVGNLDDNKS